MIDGLKPYPKMKDSGLPWLGNVPEHWEVRRAKTLLMAVDVRSASGSEELLTVSSNFGVVPRRAANVTMFKAESYSGHKLCWPGDLVINSLWAWSRGLGVSSYHGIISTAYGVYRPRDNDLLHPSYVHELVRSTPFQWELKVRSKGVWTSRLQLTDESFLGAPLPVPPIREQVAIVRFLEHADRRIRRYIRAKQKLIKLLEEQKQAIIHRAVTRGLDPDVRLKPSGVDWLGEVPEHWEVARLGRLIELTTGFPFGSEGFTQNTDDIRLLRGVNISPGKIRWDDVVRWPLTDSDKFSAFSLQAGDIALGMDRPIIRGGTRVATVTEHDVPALLLQRVARIRPRDELQGGFLSTLLAGKSFADYLAPIFTGISVPHLSPEQIRSFRIAVPPSDEQSAIVRWTVEMTRKTNVAVRSAEREIAMLSEYRTRLIADVVTGKIDVRGAATRLRTEVEEPVEPEAFDDTAFFLGDTNDPTADEAELEEIEA